MGAQKEIMNLRCEFKNELRSAVNYLRNFNSVSTLLGCPSPRISKYQIEREMKYAQFLAKRIRALGEEPDVWPQSSAFLRQLKGHVEEQEPLPPEIARLLMDINENKDQQRQMIFVGTGQ